MTAKKKPDGKQLKVVPSKPSTHIVCHIFLSTLGLNPEEGKNRTIPVLWARRDHFCKGNRVCEQNCRNQCQ